MGIRGDYSLRSNTPERNKMTKLDLEIYLEMCRKARIKYSCSDLSKENHKLIDQMEAQALAKYLKPTISILYDLENTSAYSSSVFFETA